MVCLASISKWDLCEFGRRQTESNVRLSQPGQGGWNSISDAILSVDAVCGTPTTPPCVLLELNNKTTEEDVVMAIHNMRATHAGLKFSIQLAAASQNTSEPFGSVRAAIERKFFRGALG